MYRGFKKFENIVKEEKIYIIGAILFALVGFGIYIFPHYSPDTYGMMVEAENGTVLSYLKGAVTRNLRNGRYSLGITKAVLKLIGLNPQGAGVVANACSIILVAGNILCAFLGIKHYFTPRFRILIFGTVVGIFMCPCYADWFQFPEAVPYYLLGVLLCHVGVIRIYKNKMISGILILFVAVGYYQIILSFFVFYYILILILELSEKKFDKQLEYYLINVSKGIGIYAMLVGGNFLWVKIGGSTRIHMDLSYNVSTVLHAQKSLWMMGSLGKRTYVYVGLFLIAIIVYLFEIVRLVSRNKQYVMFLIMTLLGIVGIYLSVFVTHIFSEAWVSQRTVVIFYAIPFYVIICAIKLIPPDGTKRSEMVLALVILFLNAIYIFKTNNLAIDLIKTNVSDQFVSELIGAKIDEYEKEQGIRVENISFIQDTSKVYAYPGIFMSHDLNVRAWSVSWAREPMFNFYTGKNLVSVKCPDEVYETIFKDKNWNAFSEEQVYFAGNTVYIGIY